MSEFLSGLSDFNASVNDVIWGAFGLVLLIGTGILMTVLTKCFQVTKIKLWWKRTIGRLFSKDTHKRGPNAISPFQAVCTALAATVGTGNIAGVSAAIVTGGPGAVFWMWIAAFFGMMTNFSENVLGIYYRRRNKDGEWSGGAMYYLRDGVGRKKGLKQIGKILAILFSIFAVLASFGIGSMGQVNKIVLNIEKAFPIKALEDILVFKAYNADGSIDAGNTVTLYPILLGVLVMILAGLIIVGGLKRIAAFAEKIVPFMVVMFILGSLIVIGVHYDNILPAFKAIFVTAFKPLAVVGGTFGYLVSKVITQGFKRGVFSNEAGLGSSVMVHSNSNVREPVVQGMWGIFEVFADTIIVCTMTALVVLTSGVYDLTTGTVLNGESDATLVGSAFNTLFPEGSNLGSQFIAIAMFLFAFTTILGWSHYGKKAWEYLFGTKSTIAFKLIHLVTVFFGAVLTSSLAWDISDTFNGLMMIPNLIGVVILAPLVVKITKNYVNRKVKKKTEAPVLSAFEDIQKESEELVAQESD